MPIYRPALTSNSVQVGSNNWVKIYSEIVGRWQWMTKMDVGHGDTERPPVYHLAAGTARFKALLLFMVVRFGAFGVGPAGGHRDPDRNGGKRGKNNANWHLCPSTAHRPPVSGCSMLAMPLTALGTAECDRAPMIKVRGSRALIPPLRVRCVTLQL